MRLHDDGAQVRLSVQDSGVGIAAEDVPRVFERFHRVEGARARTHEGSGIGLALVSDLVRLHGGRCTLDSTPEVGTTVTVRLPKGRAHLAGERVRESGAPAPEAPGLHSPFLVEALRWMPDVAPPAQNAAAASATSPSPPVDEPPLPGHVLVVDDNADMRDYLARLMSERWSVQTARDGLEALQAVHERRPDVVLTDIMMPRLDGLRLLRRLREDPATADLPVIVLSARAGEEARVEGIELGADDYLVKPFAARELMARVQAQLRLVHAGRERAELLARERRARTEADFQRRQLRAIIDQAPTLIAVFRGAEHVVELANDRICQA
ncbi:MAG: response regulator [Rubrivivax sp.]